MTERLYYTDSYLSYVKARVVDADPSTNLVYLDRTAFYPASGGQPHDLGTISGRLVLEVIDEGDRIAHRTAGPLTEENVECHIDWERRYDHMQQHTGQHLLSAVCMELFSIPTVSFHMGSDSSTIELEAIELTEERIEKAEQRANRIAREGRAVSVSFEEEGAVSGLRKPSARSGVLRIVAIDGLDRSACGGTHVSSTSEVAAIQIRRTERIRGNVRVEFVCGNRTERRARLDYRLASELGRMNGVGIDDLPDAVGKLRSRLADAEKERLRMSTDIARWEASALYGQTGASADGVRRVILETAAIDDAARSKAQAFSAHPESVVLLVGVDNPGVLIGCSPDSGFNAGAILREALAESGGRGGGTATLAQGNVSDPKLMARLREKLGFGT